MIISPFFTYTLNEVEGACHEYSSSLISIYAQKYLQEEDTIKTGSLNLVLLTCCFRVALQEEEIIKTGTLNLVDLAGSECVGRSSLYLSIYIYIYI